MKKVTNQLLRSLILISMSLRAVTVMLGLLALIYSAYTASGGGVYYASGVLATAAFYATIIYFIWFKRLKGASGLSSASEVKSYLRKVTTSSSLLMIFIILVAINLIAVRSDGLSVLHTNLNSVALVIVFAVVATLSLVLVRVLRATNQLRESYRSFTSTEYKLAYSEVKDWSSIAIAIIAMICVMTALTANEAIRNSDSTTVGASVSQEPYNKYTDGPPDPVEILELVNQERNNAGVAPLEMIPEMNLSAEDKVNDMATYGYFGHENNDGSRGYEYIPKRTGYLCSYVDENIASGQLNSSQVVQAWIESPSHHQAMINPDYKYTGLSVGEGLHSDQTEPAWLSVHHMCKPA